VEKARILIVEDEALVAMAGAQILEIQGYEVVGIVVCHEDAIECAAASAPDLVLMDIRLKGDIDGIDTAQMLIAQHGCRVVFVTGQGDKTTRERAEAIGPVGYLKKPFTPGQLSKAVTDALS
jgi:DNA-binding NarL/FixJ family response regulator